jgi:hypothetical protein
VSGSNAEVSEYVMSSDQQNLQQNPHPNIAIVFCENAVHRRICSRPLTVESVNKTVKFMFMHVLMCLCKIFVLNKVKYSKISHKISICQKLGTLEINALGPHASSCRTMVDRLSVASLMDW